MNDIENTFKKGDKVVCIKKATYPENMEVGGVYTVKEIVTETYNTYLTFEEFTNREVMGGVATRCFKLHNDRKSRIEKLNLK